MKWIDLNPDLNVWSNWVYGLKWADNTDISVKEVTFSNPYEADTDTGSSCIAGPSGEVDDIINQILNQASEWAVNDSWNYIYWCSDLTNGLLPTFSLDYGGHWMEVTPEMYSINVGSSEGEDVCAPCIGSYNINYWVLGQAFLRDWYVIHDYANARFGFIDPSIPLPEDPGLNFNLRGFLSVSWGLGFSIAVFYLVYRNRPPPK